MHYFILSQNPAASDLHNLNPDSWQAPQHAPRAQPDHTAALQVSLLIGRCK